MAGVGVDGAVIRIALTVAEEVMALHRGDIVLPLAQVDSVQAVETIETHRRGLRIPGSSMPGMASIGTFRGDGFRDFVIIHRHGPGVVITAHDTSYDQVLISTDDPQAMVDALT